MTKYIVHYPSAHEPPDAVFWFEGERLREHTEGAMVSSNPSILEARHMMFKRPNGYDVAEFFDWVMRHYGQTWEVVDSEEGPEKVLLNRQW